MPHLVFECDGLNGEDISFCARARNQGIRCRADCRVRVGHRRAVEVIFDPERGEVVQGDDVNEPLNALFAAVGRGR